MSTIWVVLVYAVALAVALFILFRFRSLAWYWHLLAVIAALGLGLMTPPPGWQGPIVDLTLGGVFLLLVVWGVGGFMLRHKHA